jgi:hypothetical protein
VFTGILTVDFGGSVGAPGGSRTEQIRLQYASGPITVAFGLQGPQASGGADQSANACYGSYTGHGNSECDEGRDYWLRTERKSFALTNTPNLPSFGAHMLYDAPGGHQLFLGTEVQQNNIDKDGRTRTIPSGEMIRTPVLATRTSSAGLLAQVPT